MNMPPKAVPQWLQNVALGANVRAEFGVPGNDSALMVERLMNLPQEN